MRITYQRGDQPNPLGGAERDRTKFESNGKEGTVTHLDNRATAVDYKRHTASLENHATVVSVGYLFWVIPVPEQQEIFAHEDLALKTNDIVFVQGKQRVQLNGEDIAEMTFHADFHRVPGVLEK